MPAHPISSNRLTAHLASTYGVAVTGLRALDVGVFRVDRADGPSWVARVFPESRAPDGAAGDATILKALERAGFPAERCATDEPVSALEGRSVLVTEFVPAGPALRPGRTGALLGALLGRLHAQPAAGVRPGGAWHHLSFTGTPRAEVAAARESLERAQSVVGLRELALYHELCDAVERTDDCEDLPHGFVHADFVGPNAIPTADGMLVIVDWAGSGRGPRLWSLGFLLWAAGTRSPKLVDVVASRYRRHVTLEPAELERLAGAIRARPVMLECWSFGAGRRELADALARVEEAERLASTIADQARRALAAPT
jgi:Ser/Thr protein kinase RdoA (MazF antagonist)